MQKGLTLLSSEVSIGIAEDKSNCGEEVTLARTVAPDDDIVFRRKWLDNGLVLVARQSMSMKSIRLGNRMNGFETRLTS